MSKLKYILLSLFLLLGFSCIKDELAFKPKELDDITIEGLKKSYTVESGTKLRIEPTVITKFDTPDDQFDYIWYTYADAPGGLADTISREKILDVVIDRVQSGIPHIINLKVVSKKDKTFALKTADLNTTSHFSGGIVALVKNDNTMDIAFLKNGQSEVENNLFTSANSGKTLSSSSYKIFSVDACNPQPGIYRRVMVATDDENITVGLSPDRFEIIESVKDLFFTPQQFTNNKLHATGNSQGDEFLLIGNKLYDRELNRYSADNTPLYNAAILCALKPTNIDLAPFILHPNAIYGEPIVFDNNAGRFMYRNSDSPTFSFFTNSPDGTAYGFFDPNNLRGMSMLCAGYYDDNLGKMWMLMEDANTNSRRILAMTYDSKDWVEVFNTENNREISRSAAPNLYNTDRFITTSYAKVGSAPPWEADMKGVNNAFLYIVNNKLYIYNIANDYEGILVDGDAEGFTIDNAFVHSTFLLNNQGEKDEFVRLGLAIRDKQGSNKKGGIAYYRINTLGGLSATQYFKKTGFCDQVISFDEKIN